MNPITTSYLASFWSAPVVEANLLVFLNLAGALALGLLVGYERSYHGRAAGMRTYGIVCMASAALTVFAGYPGFWWGGTAHSMTPVDPTRVVQGIVTGVGFLGAGVIMKEGLNISGLTTAASIWASSAIGVLVGVGFYAAAILLSVLSASLMMWGPKLEARLPSRRAMGVMLGFEAGVELLGTEVKSLRQGHCSLNEAYAQVRDGEVFLVGATIEPYAQGNRANHARTRDRRLLLHRGEIQRIDRRVAERGWTLVPLRLYFKDGRVKLELALGRGKDVRDKRQTVADRDARREIARALKEGS